MAYRVGVYWTIFVVFLEAVHGEYHFNGRCEQIKVPMCSNIPYNETILPNLLGHTNQEDAGRELNRFLPVVNTQCSRSLRFFLCTVYLPVCTILEEPIPPCRSFCVQARAGCAMSMSNNGLEWPAGLDCDLFPPSGLCVGASTTDDNQPITTTTAQPATSSAAGWWWW